MCGENSNRLIWAILKISVWVLISVVPKWNYKNGTTKMELQMVAAMSQEGCSCVREAHPRSRVAGRVEAAVACYLWRILAIEMAHGSIARVRLICMGYRVLIGIGYCDRPGVS